ncbi:MAG: hypothetical protein AB2614_20770, partial [Candidatus Thiodiazotropha endolucinida]|nr:GNAT family N-acetyltransferase [Candidatus Thiodiazotropha taylori]MCG7889163.1 GNAT family N-acetyltransferase [Candidatus Thiodiazotropha taylori]MCW4246683.1 GNAT family N-acetyltransferase [Candidatus Thiodiazotropha endolucinida]MCW4269817.1 GNAT family N-acetyltransferase [Candidatus Thiodiazotropha endolucinida]
AQGANRLRFTDRFERFTTKAPGFAGGYLLVSTNEGAIRLWKKLGFQVIGTLPKAFKSQSAGYVDALVMYKEIKT